MALSRNEKAVVAVVLLGGLLPIWGSGMNRGLTAYQFIYNHTIWGPRPMYVPEEYTQSGEPLFRVSGLGRRPRALR